jgi:hypothetical protein
MGATTSSSAESGWPERARSRYARGTTTGSGGTHLGCRLGRELLGLRPRGRLRRARSASAEPRDGDSPSWVPLLLVVRSRGGRNGHEAGTRAEPPLEVVAPIWAVDWGASCSGCALEDDFVERAARALNRGGRQSFMGATTSSSAESCWQNPLRNASCRPVRRIREVSFVPCIQRNGKE